MIGRSRWSRRRRGPAIVHLKVESDYYGSLRLRRRTQARRSLEATDAHRTVAGAMKALRSARGQ